MTLYREATGGDVLARVVGRLEVDRLELPRSPGGRYRVALRYPVRVTAWLDANTDPLEISAPMDLVPKHLRIQVAAPAMAWSTQAGQATLRAHVPSRALQLRWTYPHLLTVPGCDALALEPAIQTASAEGQMDAACSDLRLTGSDAAAPSGGGQGGDRNGGGARSPARLLRDGRGDGFIPVFRDERDATPFARVHGHIAVRVFDEKGARTQVGGDGAGYRFLGWVESIFVSDHPAGHMGLLPASPGPDAMSPRGAAVGVRLLPEKSAPVVMTLDPEAVVYVHGDAGKGFAEVELGELSAGEPRYFVERDAVEPYVTRHHQEGVPKDQFFCASD